MKDICGSPCYSCNRICLLAAAKPACLTGLMWSCRMGGGGGRGVRTAFPKILWHPHFWGFLSLSLLSQVPRPVSPSEIHLSTCTSITPDLTAQEEATRPAALRRSPSGCPRQNPPPTPPSPFGGAPNRYRLSVFPTTPWSEDRKRDISNPYGQERNTKGRTNGEKLPR